MIIFWPDPLGWWFSTCIGIFGKGRLSQDIRDYEMMTSVGHKKIKILQNSVYVFNYVFFFTIYYYLLILFYLLF